jgi:arsenate reductase
MVMIKETKTKVLFLCSHNSARSQIAEAFLRHFAGEYFEVYSAGLEKSEVHELTKKVMQELNYDISDQYSKDLSDYRGYVHFGILITVCSEAEEKCPIMPGLGTRLHWPFDDPSIFEGTEEEKIEKFREVRDQILKKILEWVKERGLDPNSV